MMSQAQKNFLEYSKHESDIKGHMQFIYGQSGGIVLECGVRDGYSTSALLLGVERDDGHLFSVDRNGHCGRHYPGHPKWTFIEAYSTDEEKIEEAVLGRGYPAQFDLIFLDTEHTYETVYQELSVWSPHLKPEGAILIHDVETYFKGAGDACRYFAYREKWDYTTRTGWNGLGVLRRKK